MAGFDYVEKSLATHCARAGSRPRFAQQCIAFHPGPIDMNSFHTTREIAAPPEAIFAAIATPARLAKWWGPDGFSNSFEVCDFRPGGQWIFTMQGPDGTRYPNQSEFEAIEDAHKVVIRHACAPLFRLTIALEPIPSGTRVRWTQVFDDPATAAAVRHIVEPANEQNLTRLGAEVAAGSF